MRDRSLSLQECDWNGGQKRLSAFLDSRENSGVTEANCGKILK